MGLMDNLKDKSNDIMDDPSARKKIEQISKEHNISIEEAKTHYMSQRDS